MIIKNYTTPTDILIIGTDISGFNTGMITDDYTCLEIKMGKKTHYIETDGFFSILTMEEFITSMKDLENENIYENNTSLEVLLVKNYIGDINAKVLDENLKEHKFDLSEIMFSIEDYNADSDYDFFLNLEKSEYTYFYEEKPFTEYIDYIIREKKINDLLK